MDMLIKALMERYSPIAIVLYGSFADGTNNADSDLDVLLITQNGDYVHDNSSVINGVLLDAFIYPRRAIEALEDPLELVQLYHSRILFDTDDHLAQKLVDQVRACVHTHTARSQEEKLEHKAWAQKMLRRSRRGDAEGLFRAHWLLTDSLEFYCVVRDLYYFGPKKTLIVLAQNDPQGYALYERALRDLSRLDAWIAHVFAPMAA